MSGGLSACSAAWAQNHPRVSATHSHVQLSHGSTADHKDWLAAARWFNWDAVMWSTEPGHSPPRDEVCMRARLPRGRPRARTMRCAGLQPSSIFLRLSRPPRYTPFTTLIAPASLSASGGLSEVFLRLNAPLQMTSVVPSLPARTASLEE